MEGKSFFFNLLGLLILEVIKCNGFTKNLRKVLKIHQLKEFSFFFLTLGTVKESGIILAMRKNKLLSG